MLDIPVAVKEYYPKGYANRNVTQNLNVTITDNSKNAYFDKWKMKFPTEARMLAKFANLPGIVNVYDFFEQNGTAYIVMEYLDGITLKNYVEENGPMEPVTFFKSLIPVLTSLEKIHKQGLIHRDISPDNLMLMDDGFLKLYDFGAAREYSDATQQNFSVIIKPCFAPEEQYRSKGVQGPWTDVYSICATIYFSITGVVPDDSLQRAFSDDLKKPSELGVVISPKIEATLLKGMNVRSADRFDSVMPLVAAFVEADSKPVRKKGFGAGKKSKSRNNSGIFSIFRTSSHQIEATSGLPSTSASVPTTANDKTEIILNTEYESNSEYLLNPADNEVKRRAKHNQSDDILTPVATDDKTAQKVQEAENNQIMPLTFKQDTLAEASEIDNKNIPKKEIFNGLLDNAELGLVPHKPILVCGMEGCLNYLKCLYTSDSTPLIPIHRGRIPIHSGSISANNIPQKIEVFDVVLQNRELYGTLYFNIYSSFNTKAVPAGYVYGKPHAEDNDKNEKPKLSIACPKCNATIPSDAKFCGMCGTQLLSIFNSEISSLSSSDTSAINKASIECPNCKAVLPTGAKFCGMCGILLLKA